MTRTRTFAPALLAASLLLSGCAGSIDTSGAVRVDDGAPTTINAAELAIAAEGVVAEQGFTVDIDCGADDVPFVVGTSLECAAFDEATETSGAYTVTISSIDGTDYVLDVVGSEVAPTPPAESAFETAAAFAGLTADALSGPLGETPVVDCGTADIEIFTGQEVRCAYEASSGSGIVIATVTSFDGSFYEISVVEE
ncbi:hypothetical protein [Microcella sp.]|uniref:hypothetical protein n=1 Tax=Microcella sp. TaxID=1913979 RepID=UPI003F71C46A